MNRPSVGVKVFSWPRAQSGYAPDRVSRHDFRFSTEHPPAGRPVLLWDGACGFCRMSVERVAYQVGDRVAPAPYQEAGARFPDIPEELMARSVHLIETDGRVHVGADAIFSTLAHGGKPAGKWFYTHVPGFAWASEVGYDIVSSHRHLVTRLVRWLVGPDLLPRQHRLTRWLFLRLLGLAALCAFLSMAVQLDGLIGSNGVMPAADFMARVGQVAAEREALPAESAWGPLDRYLQVPTLLWIASGDDFLWALVLAGIALSLLLIVDVAPGPCALGLWASYLSLMTAGGVFFRYQWDVLLLESLLVALFLAPWRLRPRLRTDAAPPLAGVWLARLLVFKLMLLSGLVKVLADPVWTDLSALSYHFFTQPIPTWTAYYAHHAPGWLLALATLIALFVELVLPWFVLGPRRLRIVFALGTVLLMVLIALTGNYGFFNLLAIALAVMLLDDTALGRVVPRRWRVHLPDIDQPPARAPHRALRAGAWILAAMVIYTSAAQMARRVAPGSDAGAWALRRAAPFLSVNAYGLFADMTTSRPEIVIEGSRDGESWQAYAFHWKAGDLDARPRFVGPHMPRLDWQMWFAALGRCQRSPWLHALMQRLLEGAPAVQTLLARDPFGDAPPRYLRTTLHEYTFAPMDADDWWQRRTLGPYCPVVTLRDGRLVAVPAK